jgi:hypothetical protein
MNLENEKQQCSVHKIKRGMNENRVGNISVNTAERMNGGEAGDK